MELTIRVSSFTEGHREALRLIEEAYVVSRYLAKTYERKDAEKAIEATGELIILIEGVKLDVSPRLDLDVKVQAQKLKELLKWLKYIKALVGPAIEAFGG